MDKPLKNSRVKKRLLKDFGEVSEHHNIIIGADGADETKEKSISNSKFYHLRAMPKKIYLMDDDDADGESVNEDFSPAVSEYMPSPERQNHDVSTPSSSLGGDSDYIEAVQSKISRTPSTISNVSFVLNQIHFVASPSEVFIADNDNSSFTSPKTKNLKQNYGEIKNIVDITLKPDQLLNQNQIRSINFIGQPTSANSSPERKLITCKHTNVMQSNEIDTTLTPEEISAVDLTLRSSHSSDDSFSVLDSLDPLVNNNLPLIVSSSPKPQNGLSSPIRDEAPVIVFVHEIILPSTDVEPKKDLLVFKNIMPHNDPGSHDIPVSEPDAVPERKEPSSEIIMPSNVEPKKDLPVSKNFVSHNDPGSHDIPVPEPDAEPERNEPSSEIIMPSNVEPKKDLPVSKNIVSHNDPGSHDIPVPEPDAELERKELSLEIIMPSKVKPRKDLPVSKKIVSTNDPGSHDIPVPEPDAEPERKEPSPEIIMLSNVEPRKDLPVSKNIVSHNDSVSHNIPVPEPDAEPERKEPSPEIIMPSNVEPKKDVPASQVILPSSIGPVRNYGPVPEIIVSSYAEPLKELPSPEIMVPSNADVIIVVPPNDDLPVLETDALTDAESVEEVPSNDNISVYEIMDPSNTEPARKDDNASPEIILPPTDDSVNDGSAPVIATPSTSELGNHAPSSENDVSGAEPPKNPTRKRKLDVEKWQCKKNKKLKDSGLAYKSCHSKKEHPAKTMGPSCTCKKACSERISPEKRKEIFDQFYKIGNHEYQWQFIVRNVQAQDIKRITINRKCNRTQTLKYYFLIDGVKEVVCKNFFLNTLNISDTVVYTALEKVKKDESLVDLRGCHDNRPHKTSSLTEESVVQHINLFPTVEAHYVRKDSQKLYLHDDLNISKMFRLYKKWFSEQENYRDDKMASARQYRKIFNTQFNYSFFKPKKDQCAICTRYQQADEDTKKTLQLNYDMHIKNKETVRKIKDAEKEKLSDSETIAIFDLEKVLYIPKSEVGVFYYKRKYPVYNFTVFDAGRKLGYCFMWHHVIAKRGAIEIGSCILKFLENEYFRSNNKISLYSDGCRGQNKNRFIFALYMYAAKKFRMNITHRFFVTGHSQNEGDSMHACIERELKKNKVIYTPEQMYGIAMNAKVTGEKYNVVEMEQSDFINIKVLINGQNWVQDSNGNKVMWSNIMEVNACHTQPGKLKFKYSFEDEYLELNTSPLPCRVRRRAQSTRGGRARAERASVSTSSTAESIILPELEKAYNQPIPVSKALHSDLLNLCSSHDIPRHYHDFYESLICGTDENGEVQDPLQESSSEA